MPYSNIDKPSKYFNTITYTGTGVTSTAITGVGFQPDFLWVKIRSGADNHVLVDAVRGSNQRLFSNLTNAESGSPSTIISFDSNGFTLGTAGAVNGSGSTYVAWNWLASNTSGSSNTSGTITSTVSANTTSGFSIVSYTGTGSAGTVGHSLGTAPSMIMVKSRSSPPADHWFVYHKSNGNTGSQYLNLTSAFATGANDWNNTTPTSSVFSIGTQSGINYNGGTFIAYCFAEVKGFSKAFSYTGNGSTDGTYIHLGFRPAFVMTKASSTTGNWKTSWNSFTNGSDYNLAPNLSGAEGNANQIDLLSNGFKCRATDTDRNGSGTTYIGFAFAENPFVSSKGIPTTAR